MDKELKEKVRAILHRLDPERDYNDAVLNADLGELLAVIKDGYVKLADDQTLPRWRDNHLCVDIFSYDSGQQDMLKKSWRKVELRVSPALP